MPDKPVWYSRLDQVIAELEALPSPWVDSASLELVLSVGRRRAQQILRPLVRDTIGKSGLAKRDEVVDHLRGVAAGNAAYYEMRRRERLRSILDQVRQAATQPRILVEASASIVRQEFENLLVSSSRLAGLWSKASKRPKKPSKSSLRSLWRWVMTLMHSKKRSLQPLDFSNLPIYSSTHIFFCSTSVLPA